MSRRCVGEGETGRSPRWHRPVKMPVTSDKLFAPPMDTRYLLVLYLCGGCALLSFLSAVRLVLRHLRTGRARTGLLTPDEQAAEAMAFALSIPVFAGLSFLAVVLVELAEVWTFFQTLILAQNFARIPECFTRGNLGMQRLHHLLRSQELPAVRVYGHAPCCCLRAVWKESTPRPDDFPRLKLGIWQMCVIVPLFEFLDVIVAEEVYLGSVWVRSMPLPWMKYRQIAKVVSQLYCVSCCKGLAELVTALEDSPEEKRVLGKKLLYCQSYVWGMNLIPNLLWGCSLKFWGTEQLLNEAALTHLEMSNFITHACTCVATVVVTAAAWRAFPPVSDELPGGLGGGSMRKPMLSSTGP